MQCPSGDRTPIRRQFRSRRDWFTDDETADLISLPEHPGQEVTGKKAKVSRDWHIQINTIKYSVLAAFVGTTVDVRIVGTILDVFADGAIRHSPTGDEEALLCHASGRAPATQGEPTGLWYSPHFLHQAIKVGPAAVEALTRLLGPKKIEAQGLRACMNILALGKGDNRTLLEQAYTTVCADENRPISYTAIKHQITTIRAQSR